MLLFVDLLVCWFEGNESLFLHTVLAESASVLALRFIKLKVTASLAFLYVSWSVRQFVDDEPLFFHDILIE